MKKILLILSLAMSVNAFADVINEQKKVYKEASKTFEETCYDVYQYGCIELGFLYEDGKFVEKDLNKAIKLYKKSCSSIEFRGHKYRGQSIGVSRHLKV